MGWGGPRIFAFACALALLLHHHLGSIHDLLPATVLMIEIHPKQPIHWPIQQETLHLKK